MTGGGYSERRRSTGTLGEQQGRLLPVYLDTVKLRLPYLRNSLLVSHMMLMSYAGAGLLSRTTAALNAARAGPCVYRGG